MDVGMFDYYNFDELPSLNAEYDRGLYAQPDSYGYADFYNEY
jgi:hypothetical protein